MSRRRKRKPSLAERLLEFVFNLSRAKRQGELSCELEAHDRLLQIDGRDFAIDELEEIMDEWRRDRLIL